MSVTLMKTDERAAKSALAKAFEMEVEDAYADMQAALEMQTVQLNGLAPIAEIVTPNGSVFTAEGVTFADHKPALVKTDHGSPASAMATCDIVIKDVWTNSGIVWPEHLTIPVAPATDTQVLAALRGALAMLEAGWCQGRGKETRLSASGPVVHRCGSQAIMDAAGGAASGAAHLAIKAHPQLRDWSGIPEWNDAPNRTKNQVLTVYRDTIARLEERVSA